MFIHKDQIRFGGEEGGEERDNFYEMCLWNVCMQFVFKSLLRSFFPGDVIGSYHHFLMSISVFIFNIYQRIVVSIVMSFFPHTTALVLLQLYK